MIAIQTLIFFQGKGLQKTYWLDGRKGLSLPLLSSQIKSDDLSDVLNVED